MPLTKETEMILFAFSWNVNVFEKKKKNACLKGDNSFNFEKNFFF